MHKELIGQTEFVFKMVDYEEMMDEIYRLRYHVYGEECGFIKEEDCPDGLEKDQYDPYSLHFVAKDSQGIIGTARLILDNPMGFPMEKKCKGHLSFNTSALKREEVAEISRLVIAKRYRRRRDDGLYYGKDYGDAQVNSSGDIIKRIKPMAFGLYREMYQACKRQGVNYWFALMEKALWVLLRMHYFTFQPIGEEVNFYGSVKPYLCTIGDVEKLVAQKSPKLFKYFIDGLERGYQPRLSEKQEA